MKIKTTLYGILSIKVGLFALGCFSVFFLMANLKDEVTALQLETQIINS